MNSCCSGRKRQSLLGGEHHLFVLKGETDDFTELADEREIANAAVDKWSLIVREKENAIDDLLVDMAAEVATLMDLVNTRESEKKAIGGFRLRQPWQVA